MSFKIRFVSFGVCAAAVLAVPAVGGQLDMSFAGRGLHQSVTIRHGRFVSPASPDGAVRVAAGQNLWDIAGSAGPASGHRLFSAELGRLSSSEASLRSILDASSLEQGKGAARAGVVQTLYASVHGLSSLSDAHAAAFQISIWEIVHEEAFNPEASTFASSGLDAANGELTQGGFAVGTGRTGARDPIAAMANQWLAQAWQRWFSGETGMMLSIAEGPGTAGQILAPIPLPATGGLALVGLAAIGGYRRRRA